MSIMSTVADDVNPHAKRLSNAVKSAIVAAIAQGHTQTAVAKRFNCTRQTVATICRPVQNLTDSPLAASWRAKLMEEMPAQSVEAMRLSITATDDPHKAASTAIAHLKGIGVLAGDGGSQTVNVFVANVMGLPADWQAEYLSVDATPSSVSDTLNIEGDLETAAARYEDASSI